MGRYEPALTPSQELALALDTAQRHAKRLKRNHADAMRRILKHGSGAWCKGYSRGGGAIARMFGRMVAEGLVRGPPYQVSPYGLRVLESYDAALQQGNRIRDE
jgi:hypothetical protein